MGITYTSIERICVDGKCHCDWRLTIHDCEEAHYLYYIYVVNIALSAVVSIMGKYLTELIQYNFFFSPGLSKDPNRLSQL